MLKKKEVEVNVRPFLRWAGGKNWLVKNISDYLPNSINNYYEPFLGGGSIFISLKKNNLISKKAYLGDINFELINAYKIIKKNPDGLIEKLRNHKNTKAEYYEIRSQNLNDPLARAARFIFLNRTSFNGIYRENLKGEYNVPYGYKNYKILYDFENIRNLSLYFKNCFFRSNNFTHIKNEIKEGDFVFLDPPYTVAHENNGFVKYNQKIFSWKDQLKLQELVIDLQRRNINYILTNACHDSIKNLYKDIAIIKLLERPSLVGGKNAKRQKYREYLITNVE